MKKIKNRCQISETWCSIHNHVTLLLSLPVTNLPMKDIGKCIKILGETLKLSQALHGTK
jgi:hypothetical protein